MLRGESSIRCDDRPSPAKRERQAAPCALCRDRLRTATRTSTRALQRTQRSFGMTARSSMSTVSTGRT